jgi:hypothetical protein
MPVRVLDPGSSEPESEGERGKQAAPNRLHTFCDSIGYIYDNFDGREKTAEKRAERLRGNSD